MASSSSVSSVLLASGSCQSKAGAEGVVVDEAWRGMQAVRGDRSKAARDGAGRRIAGRNIVSILSVSVRFVGEGQGEREGQEGLSPSLLSKRSGNCRLSIELVVVV